MNTVSALGPKTDFRGQRVTVMGLGLFGGGSAVARWLIQAGARVTITDLRTRAELAPSIRSMGEGTDTVADEGSIHAPTWVLGKHRAEDFKTADWVVANPAVPMDNKWLTLAREHGVGITSEMELFLTHCHARVVLISGTEGKSSTVRILTDLLKGAGMDAIAGGNIGHSLLAAAAELNPTTVAVIEISSYQLEALPALAKRKRGAEVVALTNVRCDHLERHGTPQAYADAKARILARVRSGGHAFLPLDLHSKASFAVPGDVSLHTHGGGAGEANLTRHSGGFWYGDTLLGREDALPLPGVFQRDNALLALGIAHALGAEPAALAAGLCHLQGLDHRLQSLGQVNGRTVIDNGVSTTPESTISALASVAGDCTLLLGGQAKAGLDFEGLAQLIRERRARAVTFGASGEGLHAILQGANAESIACANLAEAATIALQNTPVGGTLLFSPACASFDAYLNFRERALALRKILGLADPSTPQSHDI